MGALRDWLAHPATRGLALDDPRTTEARRQVLRAKPFLRRIYLEWYGLLRAALPSGHGAVLELGSGAGFLRDVVPEVVTSEVFCCSGIDLVLDGQRMPFRDGSLRAILMVDVLHHLPDCRRFFEEAARCVRPGGVVALVEPWATPWSAFVYRRFHHEPFLPGVGDWAFPTGGPLSGANQALPWVVFERDRARFDREFPQLRVDRVIPMMPIRYLLSGGIGMRCLAPGWSYGMVASAERVLQPWNRSLGMFAHIVLERVAGR